MMLAAELGKKLSEIVGIINTYIYKELQNILCLVTNECLSSSKWVNI